MQAIKLKRASILAGVFLFLLLSACNKDDKKENVTPTLGNGFVEYDGKTYGLDYALYEDYGQNSGVYNFEIYLYSSGIDMEEESGTGNVVAIYFYSNKPPIPVGLTPYFTEFVNPVPTVEAELVLDYNLETEEGTAFYNFVGGQVRITQLGEDQFRIEFSFFLNSGKNITGEFSGRIDEF